PPHGRRQLHQERLTLLRLAGQHLHAQLLPGAALIGRPGDKDDQRRRAIVDEVEPELHAGEDAVVGEVKVDVVHRSLGQQRPAAATTASMKALNALPKRAGSRSVSAIASPSFYQMWPGRKMPPL